jgi:hypothetical protein
MRAEKNGNELPLFPNYFQFFTRTEMGNRELSMNEMRETIRMLKGWALRK